MGKTEHAIDVDRVVGLEYRLTLDDGEVADDTDGAVFFYLHGAQEIVPGLEKALLGKRAGDAFEVAVLPQEGFGDEDPELYKEVPLEIIQQDGPVEVGDEVALLTEDDEEVVGFVEAIEGDTARVDFNHPLAGETLHFKGCIVSVREASADELEAGMALEE